MNSSAQLAMELAESPKKILERIERQGKPVLFELEQSLVRFRSKITLKEDKVILSKPAALKKGIVPEVHVRFHVPASQPSDMRLKVMVPHAELPEGGAVLICGVPDALTKSSRTADRYSVAQNQSLQLEIRAQKFQLVDLSLTGFRIAVKSAHFAQEFPQGKSLLGANLMLGPSVWVRLARVIPHSFQAHTIGFEFKVAGDDVSIHNLYALVDSLKRTPL